MFCLLTYINYIIYFMKAAPKVMPPVLLCWCTTSEVDVGGMAVEIESSHQHSMTYCCCVTDGSREAVWQNGVWLASVYEAKEFHWILPCRKKLCPLILLDYCRIFMETMDVSTLRWWVVCFSSGDSEMKDKPHSGQSWRLLQAQHGGSSSLLVKMYS